MPRAQPVSHAGCTWTGLASEQLPSETLNEKMGPVPYFSLCLLGCLIFSPSLAETQAMSCPAGWFSFHDTCYRFFPQEKNWMEAEDQHWRWSDNSMLSFTVWEKGQPNKLKPNEHCAGSSPN
ncbi:C-type lectin lectoxin-Enh2-like [Chelonoidis abingdonii]|uniref:C-type lectin lectoxin-Enh2-like n=1 Tax=Chelonoidis abingdonii TaxID=106734 RepID=UPI003F497AF9